MKRESKLLLLIAALGLLLPEFALAAISENNLLDGIVTTYQSAATSWSAVLTNAALWLFFTLAVIEIVWTGLTLVMRDADLGEVIAEITYRIIFIGFFLGLLLNGGSWAQDIINSLRSLAGQASTAGGGGNTIGPSDVFDSGLQLADKMTSTISFWDDAVDALGLILASIIIIIVFALLAAKLIMILVEMWIVIFGGIILLGFGGSRFTSDFALKYLIYAFSVGMKLMVTLLIIGIGESFINSWVANWANSDSQVLIAIGASIVLLALVSELPNIMQGLMTGMSFSTGDSLVRSTGQVMRGSVAAGATVVGAGLGIAGGASAVTNAVKLANAQGANGVGGTIAQAAKNFGSALKSEVGETAQKGSLAGPKSGMSHRMAAAMKTATKDLKAQNSNSIEKG